MKVGPHSGFGLKKIIEMKKKEESIYGKFFWGYSGVFCRLFKTVKFVEKCLKNYGIVPTFVAIPTKSKYFSHNIGKITEYSIDGKQYHPLPSKVLLIGCKYALICKNLKEVDMTLDLNRYIVRSTKKTQKPLGEYVKYRVNKACAVLMDNPTLSSKHVNVSFIADLIDPFCVFLR